MRSLFGYGAEGFCSVASIAGAHTIDLTSSAKSARVTRMALGGLMDLNGLPGLDGSNPSILFSPPCSVNDDLLVRVAVTEAFLGPDSEAIRVQVFFEDEQLARWYVGWRYGLTILTAVLPARLMSNKQLCRLTFHIENHAIHASACIAQRSTW